MKAAAITAATTAAAGAAVTAVVASKGQNAAHLIQSFGPAHALVSGSTCTTLYTGSTSFYQFAYIDLESNSGLAGAGADLIFNGEGTTSSQLPFIAAYSSSVGLNDLGNYYYPALSCATLQSLSYSTSTQINNLQVGRVFAVKTRDGDYAKCQVTAVTFVNPYFDITLEWETY